MGAASCIVVSCAAATIDMLMSGPAVGAAEGMLMSGGTETLGVS